MAIYKEDIVSIELSNGAIHRSFLNHSIGTGDNSANRFGIRVFRNGSEVDLSGASCQAYFQNAEGTNIALTSYGTVSGNVAYVTLPQACYNVEGQFCLAIKLIGGGVTGTMRIIDGMVCNTGTTGAVAPTSSVPTYQEILSTYAAMVSATSAANLAIAEEFDASKNYPAGKNVINDGALYVLPNGHTAGTTWANTTKVASNLGDQVTDLKSAFNADIKPIIFEIGTLNDTGFVDSDKRIRSVAIRASKGTNVRAGAGYSVTIHEYSGLDVINDYIDNSGWGSNAYATHDNCKYIRICAKKTDESIISESEINTIKSNLQAVILTSPEDLYNTLKFEESYRASSWIAGRKVSIIGDSVSTFNKAGWKWAYNGVYNLFYPRDNIDVSEYTDTWMYRVLSEIGANLEVNASYSGSCSSNVRQSGGYPDFYDRVSVLGSPDLIFVALGTNDYVQNAPIGEYDFETAVASLDESKFRTSYIKGIKALKTTYPNAKIVCIALEMGYAYKESIRVIADKLGVYFCDATGYSNVDNIHPNKTGMVNISRKILENDFINGEKERIRIEKVIAEEKNSIIGTEEKQYVPYNYDFRQGTIEYYPAIHDENNFAYVDSDFIIRSALYIAINKGMVYCNPGYQYKILFFDRELHNGRYYLVCKGITENWKTEPTVIEADNTWRAFKVICRRTDGARLAPEESANAVQICHALQNNGYFLQGIEWEQGGLSAATETVSDKRIRTTEYIDIREVSFLSVLPDDEINIKVHYFDSDKKFLHESQEDDSWSGRPLSLWQNGNESFIRIVASTANNDDILPSSANKIQVAISKRIKVNNPEKVLYVAARNASPEEYAYADFVCDGTNDEEIIQKAVNAIAYKGGTVQLSSGTFIISSFNTDSAGKYAIAVPQNQSYVRIKGIGIPQYYDSETGTKIQLNVSAYEGLSSSDSVTILRGAYVATTAESRLNLEITDLAFQLPYNQKKITVIDAFYSNRICIDKVTAWAYEKTYAGNIGMGNPPIVAVEGCVGIRAQGGSNQSSITDYKHIRLEGFYEAFKLGGEHLVLENCVAMYNFYGYTFGNYAWGNGAIHPMTLINCCDERNVNLPLFVNNGEYGGQIGHQAIDFINFNIEWGEGIEQYIPGQELGELATETTPGAFCGRLEYTIQDEFNGHGNSLTALFWKNGSGIRFETINQTHAIFGTSTERAGYAPNLGQKYFDTTLNKLLIYINGAWVDVNGNAIT